MEFLPEGDLQGRLRPDKKWNEIDTRATAKQILEGLAVLHGAGIAHRDLKPPNILITSPPPKVGVKIADFGTMKQVSRRKTTALRTKAGTSSYKAPEIVQLWYSDDYEGDERHTYSFKVDLWSLGCILYRMLVGSDLFRGDDELLCEDRLTKKMASVPKTLEQQGVGTGGTLFVKRLLTVDPEARYDAVTALQEFDSVWTIGQAESAT